MPTFLVHDPVVVLVVRAALALLFATAAWHKVRARGAFTAVVGAYRLVPDGWLAPATVAIAAAEGGVATLLLLPGTRTAGALGAAALLALYSFAIGVNLVRGRRTIDCGCGALGARQPIGEWLLVRNALLATAAALTVQPAALRPLGWVDWLTIGGGVAVASAAWTAIHGLAAAAGRVPAVAGDAP
jgi:hypothetical protein